MTEKESVGKLINDYFIESVDTRLRALRSCLHGEIKESGYYQSAEDEGKIEKDYKLVKKAWEEGIINVHKKLKLETLSEKEVKYIIDYFNTGKLNNDSSKAIDDFSKVTFRILDIQSDKK